MKKDFLTGFLMCFPIFVTIFILKVIFDIIDKLFEPLLGFIPWVSDHTTGISAATTLLFVYFVGLISNHVVGKRLMNFLLNTLPQRTPFVKIIYSVTRNFVDAVSHGDDGKMTGKVVWIKLSPFAPRPKMMGLLMSVVTISEEGLKDEINGAVFFSSSPFPQSGQIVWFPLDQINNLMIPSQSDGTPEEIRMSKKEFIKQEEYMGIIASIATRISKRMLIRPLDLDEENLIDKSPLD